MENEQLDKDEPGTLIKEYKGFNIMLSDDGVFFCDTKDNSLYYSEHTLKSERIKQLEKAIDNHICGGVKVGDEFYNFDSVNYRGFIKLIVTHKDSGRIVFSDNSSTSDSIRWTLYPKSIENTFEFNEINRVLSIINRLTIEMEQYRKDIYAYKENIRCLVLNLPKKVKVLQKDIK